MDAYYRYTMGPHGTPGGNRTPIYPLGRDRSDPLNYGGSFFPKLSLILQFFPIFFKKRGELGMPRFGKFINRKPSDVVKLMWLIYFDIARIN